MISFPVFIICMLAFFFLGMVGGYCVWGIPQAVPVRVTSATVPPQQISRRKRVDVLA